jgi:hypothetical protein
MRWIERLESKARRVPLRGSVLRTLWPEISFGVVSDD